MVRPPPALAPRARPAAPRPRLPPLLLAALLCLGPATPAAPQATLPPPSPPSHPPSPPSSTYRRFLTGDPADARPARTAAGLLLLGGGGDVDEAFRWFIRQAGGGDLVILRASGGDGYNDYLFRTLGGVDSVETLVFSDRTAASDPAVLASIARAEGIFLAGGDQARYLRFWKETPLAAALDAHVRAGKPLGGTSAGLAVLGEFHYSADFDPALHGGELNSTDALRDPHDTRITLGTGFLTIPRLRGVITDSHFSQRHRQGRLRVFLARLAAETQRRDLVGLGVDERTALCIEADGTFRVIASPGGGEVHAMRLAAAPAADAPLPEALPVPPALLRFPPSP